MADGSNRAPFVPPFLARLGVKPGEWMSTSKLTVRALMRPPWPLKVRIWACLMLQSCGYETDLAVVMSKGDYQGDPAKIKPLLPQGIVSMLNKATVEAFRESKVDLSEEMRAALAKISRQNMRRALAEMEEEDGLIVRVRANKAPGHLHGFSLGQCLEKGLVTPLADLSGKELKLVGSRVAVYVLAKPRPASGENLKNVVNSDYLGTKPNVSNKPIPEHQLLLAFMRRAGLKPDPALAAQLAQRPEVQKAIAAHQELIKAADASLKTFVEQILAETVIPVDAAKPPSKPTAQSPLFPPGAPAKQSTPAAVNPNGKVSSSEPPTAAAADPKPLVSQPRRTNPAAPAPSVAECYTVLQVMRRFSAADDDAAGQLVRACRSNAPQCTVVAIAEAIEVKGPLAKKKDNPVGFLLTAVPKLFEGAAYRDMERQATAAAAAESRSAAVDRERNANQIGLLKATIADPRASEADKALAREALASLESEVA